MRISYSALDTYKKCPQKYKFQEIERRKAKKSKEAIFGTSVHEALKFMFSRDPLFPTLEEVLSHFRESFSETSVISEADKVRYIESGEKMIKSFYTKNPPWNFTVIDLESRFEVALDDPHTKENHLLVGKIDRIDKQGDKKYEIIDYKTSSKLPSQEKVDSDLQLSLYQLGLQKRWPHLTPEDIVLSLYFLKAGEKLTTSRSPHDLRRTEEKLLSDIRTIEKKMAENDFPPIPSPLCNWCSFKPICPAWRHLYEKFETPKESRPAEVLVQEYAKLKQEIAEREAALKKISREIHEYLNT
ncbi:MAG: PD-(D/E)XK nuclease family protein, partial [Candidatus Ryanbacteria bacterium]|nr:PD-(D/E)XK nuclease family protein [Candidatus Ryanbacteria bacterium]